MTPRRPRRSGGTTGGARPARTRRTADESAGSRGEASIPKLQRWIDLLAALLARRYPVTLKELRRDVPAYERQKNDASLERMFERDKEELRSFGVPIETLPMEGDDQPATGYLLRPSDFYLPFLSLVGSDAGARRRSRRSTGHASLPVLAFEPDELSALTDAAARVRSLGDAHLAADVDSAMRKLAADLPVDAARSRDDELVVAHPVDARTFALLGGALVDRKIVEFEYHKMGDDTTGHRSVEPYGLVFLGSHWYLVARDRGHDELRHFRLSRMSGVSVNRARAQTPDFEVPAGFELAERSRSRAAWELGEDDAVEVVVEISASTGAARAAFELGEDVPGMPWRRRFRVRRGDTFARWLLSFGGDILPVEPAEMVDRFRAVVRSTLETYEQGVS